jgi:hypothetical protein
MTLARWKEGGRALAASVFSLTADERKIVLLILALALLGLGAKIWHRHHLAKTAQVQREEVEREGY